MKLTDNYTRDDVLALNILTFMTAMIMLILAIVAKVVGII